MKNLISLQQEIIRGLHTLQKTLMGDAFPSDSRSHAYCYQNIIKDRRDWLPGVYTIIQTATNNTGRKPEKPQKKIFSANYANVIPRHIRQQQAKGNEKITE